MSFQFIEAEGNIVALRVITSVTKSRSPRHTPFTLSLEEGNTIWLREEASYNAIKKALPLAELLA
jgi:hypothetical protein